MAIQKQDLTKFSGVAFDPYPPGPYKMKVMSKENVTSQKGTPQLKVKYRIEEGEFTGKPFTVWFPLAPASEAQGDWLVSALRAHGVKVSKDGWNDDELLNKTVVTMLVVDKKDESKRQAQYFKPVANGASVAVAPTFKK